MCRTTKEKFDPMLSIPNSIIGWERISLVSWHVFNLTRLLSTWAGRRHMTYKKKIWSYARLGVYHIPCLYRKTYIIQIGRFFKIQLKEVIVDNHHNWILKSTIAKHSHNTKNLMHQFWWCQNYENLSLLHSSHHQRSPRNKETFQQFQLRKQV